MQGSSATRTASRLSITPREAARMLGCRLEVVYRLLESGQLPARRLGRAWKISPAAIEEWLRSGDSR